MPAASIEPIDDDLVRAVRDGLAALADPAQAPRMQRYMRSTLPFRGVPAPLRRRLADEVLASHPVPDPATMVGTVRALWDGAEYREERYVALTITGHRRHVRWQEPSLLPLYEHLIVTGAWWDLVDELAVRRIGPLLRSHPAQLRPVVLAWATNPDRWRRRAAVICQVGASTRVDTGLLAACIEANLGDQDFFLRKGIGWALRQHSRVAPDWVRAFVRDHPDLSPLSAREATKHL